MDRPAAIDPALARRISRVSNDYILRALRLLTDIHHGDLVDAVICQAIIAANTGYLNQAGETAAAETALGPEGVPDDAMRKPISILALSGSIGLPFETTRRHVNRLIQSGAVQRVKGGVIVPAAAMAANPRNLEAAQTHVTYVTHFVRNLKRAGLDVD